MFCSHDLYPCSNRFPISLCCSPARKFVRAPSCKMLAMVLSDCDLRRKCSVRPSQVLHAVPWARRGSYIGAWQTELGVNGGLHSSKSPWSFLQLCQCFQMLGMGYHENAYFPFGFIELVRSRRISNTFSTGRVGRRYPWRSGLNIQELELAGKLSWIGVLIDHKTIEGHPCYR